MKRGDIIDGTVIRYDYPGLGVLDADGREVFLKGVLPGQKVRCRIKKVNASKCEAVLLEIVAPSPIEKEEGCPHFPQCGGCQMQTVPYEDQLSLKKEQIFRLLEGVLEDAADGWFEGIRPSPAKDGYRNKMEFTFGDACKGGPLVLGMHRKGSFYDIVDAADCRIVDPDIRRIRSCVLKLAAETGYPYFHRLTHQGFYRHLLVRKARSSGQILVDLVTTTQILSAEEVSGLDRTLVEALTRLPLVGVITGILHTYNDSVADAILNDRTDILYGEEYITEHLLGMEFRISPFSFFQTNSAGAEVLYETVRRYISVGMTPVSSGGGQQTCLSGGCQVSAPLRPALNVSQWRAEPSAESSLRQAAASVSSGPDLPPSDLIRAGKDKVIFDLYSGTGTIAQILAPVAKHVTGVEIVPEAVEAARRNAVQNHLTNCDFICGDVLKVIDSMPGKPDMIVLDPPREGIHPKAMPKILKYGVDTIVYISCKATSLKRDLVPLQQAGYRVEKVMLVDLFPSSCHVETVVLMSKVKE